MEIVEIETDSNSIFIGLAFLFFLILVIGTITIILLHRSTRQPPIPNGHPTQNGPLLPPFL